MHGIVTGAGRGLGRALAIALANDGIRVGLVGRRSAQLDETRELVEDAGGTAWIFPCDVSDESDVERTVTDFLSRTTGRCDVLINNAGVGVSEPVQSSDTADWRRMIDTNLLGTAYMSKAVLTTMLDQGRGDILNIASVAGVNPQPTWAMYCASKFGVVGFSAALAREVIGRGVRVQTLCPGGIDTPFWDDLEADFYKAGTAERRQIMAPESVADMALAMLRQPRNVLVRQTVMFPINEWN
jgi:3-oxoacyl-[acyl-carrier protein] reductase